LSESYSRTIRDETYKTIPTGHIAHTSSVVSVQLVAANLKKRNPNNFRDHTTHTTM